MLPKRQEARRKILTSNPRGPNKVSCKGKSSHQSYHKEPWAAPRGRIPHKVRSALRCMFHGQVITPERGKMRRDSQEEN